MAGAGAEPAPEERVRAASNPASEPRAPAAGPDAYEEALRPSEASPAQRLAPVVLALAFGGLAVAGHRSLAGDLIDAFAVMVLVVLAAIDIERRTIPNRIVLPAAAVVLAGRIAEYPHGWAEFVLAALGASVVLFIPSLLNRSAIGMGDVKLGLLVGACLGWTTIFAIPIAAVCAAPLSAAIVISRRGSARGATIPLGPFIAAGAIAVVIASRL